MDTTNSQPHPAHSTHHLPLDAFAGERRIPDRPDRDARRARGRPTSDGDVLGARREGRSTLRRGGDTPPRAPARSRGSLGAALLAAGRPVDRVAPPRACAVVRAPDGDPAPPPRATRREWAR
jgi:hypothetical protein